MSHNVYERLAFHLSTLGMGYPYKEELLEILRQNFSPREAEVALMLPTKVAPLNPVSVDVIADGAALSREELVETLDRLVERGLLFSGETEHGEKGYALLQVGFGFPQTFFWKGEDTPHARHMAGLSAQYFDRHVTRDGLAGAKTKAYRYVPPSEAVPADIQAVYPYHMMETVLQQAEVFAVAHCPCRMTARLRDRECEHPLDVCLKFDEVAQYVIDRGLAKEITREEALAIIAKSEEAGLVHFVDNAIGGVKHNCNCCGCACWNVGTIKRRKIARDELMTTYFLRDTKEDQCTGCGECVEVCPVDAVALADDDNTIVDEEWCIGCGICVTRCPNEAAKLKLRPDRQNQEPMRNFKELHAKILSEKGLA